MLTIVYLVSCPTETLTLFPVYPCSNRDWKISPTLFKFLQKRVPLSWPLPSPTTTRSKTQSLITFRILILQSETQLTRVHKLAVHVKIQQILQEKLQTFSHLIGNQEVLWACAHERLMSPNQIHSFSDLRWILYLFFFLNK